MGSVKNAPSQPLFRDSWCDWKLNTLNIHLFVSSNYSVHHCGLPLSKTGNNISFSALQIRLKVVTVGRFNHNPTEKSTIRPKIRPFEGIPTENSPIERYVWHRYSIQTQRKGNMLLGNKIRSLRDEQGILQCQVAAYLEIDTPMFSKIDLSQTMGTLWYHLRLIP